MYIICNWYEIIFNSWWNKYLISGKRCLCYFRTREKITRFDPKYIHIIGSNNLILVVQTLLITYSLLHPGFPMVTAGLGIRVKFTKIRKKPNPNPVPDPIPDFFSFNMKVKNIYILSSWIKYPNPTLQRKTRSRSWSNPRKTPGSGYATLLIRQEF